MANELPPTLSEEAARLLDEAKTRVRAQLRPKISDAAKLDAAADMAVAPLKAALKKDPNLVSMGGKGAMEWLEKSANVPPIIPPPVIPGSGHNYNGTKYYNYEDIKAAKPPVGSGHGYWNYEEAPAKEVKPGAFKAAASKIGTLIVDHPKKATGIAALVTLMAAWLWPSKKQNETDPSGNVTTVKKWGFGKKAAVTLGAVISAALITQHIPGAKSWVGKILGTTAKATGRSI